MRMCLISGFSSFDLVLAWRSWWRHHSIITKTFDIIYKVISCDWILNTLAHRYIKQTISFVNNQNVNYYYYYLLFTHGGVIAIRKWFVSSFTHVHPFIIFEFAFNDSTVQCFELFGHFNLWKWWFVSTNIQNANFFRQNSTNIQK